MSPRVAPELHRIIDGLPEPAIDTIALLTELFANLSPEETQALAAFVMTSSQMAHLELMAGRPQRKKPTRRQRSKATGAIFQLKVTLKGAKPPIWRRLLIPGEMALDKFHAIIQAAMGWQDYHLHSFAIHGAEFGPLMAGEPADWEDERAYQLDDLVAEGDRFTYLYDFGDDWEHEITVEKQLVRDSKLRYPAVTKGKGTCPPEDSGGLWGYYDKLEALKHPGSEEYEEVADWIGRDFNPDAFDLKEADQAVSVWAST